MLDFLLGNDLLSAIIAFVLVFIPAVIIHELGHFLAAKAVGITVLEFGIGMPPRAIKLFNWGETEFTLNWLPLGGFVRPLGEDLIRPVSDEETIEKDRETAQARMGTGMVRQMRQELAQADREEVAARGIKHTKSVNEARPLQRIFFMGAGAAANFLMALVLFVIVALIGLPQVVGGSVGMIDVAPESAFSEAGIEDGDVILKVDGNYFETSEEFFQRLYAAEADVVLAVQRGASGEIVDVTVSPEDLPVSLVTENLVRVLAIVPGAPAQTAGMLPGDYIVAFNGEAIDDIQALQDMTRENAGTRIELTLQRDGEETEISLTPRVNPPEGEGSMGIQIGTVFRDMGNQTLYIDAFVQEVNTSQPLDRAIQYGVDRVFTIIGFLVRVPGEIISGALSPEAARPVSFVGISQLGASALQQSIEENQPIVILNFIALISIALGFTNLLPIPALDGGRIVFVLLEIIRGRPVTPEREGLVHLVGFALLLSLIFVVTINDLINPISNAIP